MEKNLQENEIKELEEEIDSAVDRLFVENRREQGEPLSQVPSFPSPPPEPSEVPARSVDLEPLSHPAPAPPRPQSQPPAYLKSIDYLEAQLLSLEWEITDEKLRKTQEAVTRLYESLNQRADVGSVLRHMGSILEQMVGDEQNIHPPMIKFLLDAKETVKLLVREETENEINTYKQLAKEGIEARFMGLMGRKGVLSQTAASPPEEPVSEKPGIEWKRVEEGVAQWSGFITKAEGVLYQIEQHLSELKRVQPEPPVPSEQMKLPLVDVTVFRAYGKLFGVESRKIMKLYKIPRSFEEKYAQQPKVRLKDTDVILIDLKKTFPVDSWQPEGMSKLLMTQDEGVCKGLIVEEVLKRLTIELEDRGEIGKPLLGMIRWTYQARPVEVLILDLKKL